MISRATGYLTTIDSFPHSRDYFFLLFLLFFLRVIVTAVIISLLFAITLAISRSGASRRSFNSRSPFIYSSKPIVILRYSSCARLLNIERKRYLPCSKPQKFDSWVHLFRISFFYLLPLSSRLESHA